MSVSVASRPLPSSGSVQAHSPAMPFSSGKGMFYAGRMVVHPSADENSPTVDVAIESLRRGLKTTQTAKTPAYVTWLRDFAGVAGEFELDSPSNPPTRTASIPWLAKVADWLDPKLEMDAYPLDRFEPDLAQSNKHGVPWLTGKEANDPDAPKVLFWGSDRWRAKIWSPINEKLRLAEKQLGIKTPALRKAWLATLSTLATVLVPFHFIAPLFITATRPTRPEKSDAMHYALPASQAHAQANQVPFNSPQYNGGRMVIF